MNSCWPVRKRWYSAGTGSLTLTIRSAAANTSSAVRHDLGAGGGVLVVGEPGADTGAGLHYDLVAVVHQLDDAVGGEGHPLLIVLDLARYSDDERAHGVPPLV